MGLRETLEAATPGPWGAPHGFGALALRYVGGGTYQRLAVFDDSPPDALGVDGVANARLATLAPELAALVLDAEQAGICRRFTTSWCRERAEISEEDWCAWCKWLARLDQLGKEQT